jgi:hypothetical protein
VVARQYLQLGRLGHLEAESLISAGTVSAEEQRSILDQAAEARQDLEMSKRLGELLAEEIPRNDLDYRSLAEFVKKRQGLGYQTRALWKDHPLDIPEDWEWAFHALLAHVWGPRLAEAADWAQRETLKSVFSRSCGAAFVFVDETAEARLADHRAGRGTNSGGRVGWRKWRPRWGRYWL